MKNSGSPNDVITFPKQQDLIVRETVPDPTSDQYPYASTYRITSGLLLRTVLALQGVSVLKLYCCAMNRSRRKRTNQPLPRLRRVQNIQCGISTTDTTRS